MDGCLTNLRLSTDICVHLRFIIRVSCLPREDVSPNVGLPGEGASPSVGLPREDASPSVGLPREDASPNVGLPREGASPSVGLPREDATRAWACPEVFVRETPDALLGVSVTFACTRRFFRVWMVY
jgi:hypothetical protein